MVARDLIDKKLLISCRQYLLAGAPGRIRTFNSSLLRRVRLPDCATGVKLLGYLRGSVAVLESYRTTFCFDLFDNIFKQDGCKVGLLHAHTVIANVNDVSDLAIESRQHHTIGVQVTMDVDTKST